MSNTLQDFQEFRQRLNDVILGSDNIVLKRFFNLDTQAYRPGALDTRTKEMLGLVASLVLRCDDCVTYHLQRCREEGIGREELMEALAVGLVVGGSIVIPHLRRAVARLEEIDSSSKS